MAHHESPAFQEDNDMKRRILTTAVIIAAIHFVLALGSVVMSFGPGMESFEHHGHQPSTSKGTTVADSLARILLQPGLSLWTPELSENIPDAAEWGLFLLNSLLWGICLAALLNARSASHGK